MEKFNKVLIITLIAVFVLGLTGPINVSAVVAATAPNLGTAASFSVMAATTITSAVTTTISGDLGLSPSDATSRTGSWVVGGTEYFAGAAAGAKTAASDAWTAMGSTGGTAWNPVTDISPAPGLWTRAGDATFSDTLTLNGSATDVWVFQISDSLTFTGTVNLTGGAQVCNVYWRIASNATINGSPDNKFVGTLIAGSAISLVGGVTVDGRMMALTGALTTAGTTTINTLACASIIPPASSSSAGTITVVKKVINDNGGTKTAADFNLYVNGNLVISDITNTFTAREYAVTETNDPQYTRTFSGDCDVNGFMLLRQNQREFCVVTNNDIGAPVVPPVPPIIAVVKVPNPLALPSGPGLVEYTYTLRNIGTVPVTNITMTGDTCSPIVLVSGDVNGDAKLDVNETWVHTCSTTLTETHTNTVVATGWANGISATDIANAMVIVGAPIVPPLIHVTKVPSPLTLPAGGGMVTYTKKVTNPGTVALSNVIVTDDKCSSVNYISGDINSDSKLDITETWTYTCQANLTKTTINTVAVSGEANGLTARDFAIATVTVASPKLPKTGLASDGENIFWNIVMLIVILILTSISFVVISKKRTN
jgi:hypothetical protein